MYSTLIRKTDPITWVAWTAKCQISFHCMYLKDRRYSLAFMWSNVKGGAELMFSVESKMMCAPHHPASSQKALRRSIPEKKLCLSAKTG